MLTDTIHKANDFMIPQKSDSLVQCSMYNEGREREDNEFDYLGCSTNMSIEQSYVFF